jgi:hypothetical protein
MPGATIGPRTIWGGEPLVAAFAVGAPSISLAVIFGLSRMPGRSLENASGRPVRRVSAVTAASQPPPTLFLPQLAAASRTHAVRSRGPGPPCRVRGRPGIDVDVPVAVERDPRCGAGRNGAGQEERKAENGVGAAYARGLETLHEALPTLRTAAHTRTGYDH